MVCVGVRVSGADGVRGGHGLRIVERVVARGGMVWCGTREGWARCGWDEEGRGMGSWGREGRMGATALRMLVVGVEGLGVLGLRLGLGWSGCGEERKALWGGGVGIDVCFAYDGRVGKDALLAIIRFQNARIPLIRRMIEISKRSVAGVSA